ncbi:hypothetical protein ISN39_17060 [Rhizobium sp. 007]|nr:hypothetical protein ISN39_17060 [Rhizobium sp. 007]
MLALGLAVFSPLQQGGRHRGDTNQIAVIRLLTRLIFVWFIKEKGLVPEALFDPTEQGAPELITKLIP